MANFFNAAVNTAGDVFQGLIKNDKQIKDSIKKANRAAMKAGKEAMEKARIKNPNLTNRELRNIRKSAQIENGFRSTKLTAGHKVGSFLGSGTRETIEHMKNKDNFGTALKKAHTTEAGRIDAKKVAGTYIAASSVGRIASGGGLMKDKNGNSNLIGIPFI